MIAGSILALKPLMRLDEGVVVPHERTRTRSKAIDGLVNFAKDFPHIRQMGALRLGDSDIERCSIGWPRSSRARRSW